MRLSTNAAALLLLAAGPLMAQDAKPPKQDTTPPAGTRVDDKDKKDQAVGRVWRATKLIDAKVKDAKGEKIGEIEDLVIDRGAGRVAYGILSFGGWGDLGDKLFAIPFETMVRTGDEEVIVLNTTKEQLKAAPNFAKDKWPDFNRQYTVTVYEYYKVTPYWFDKRIDVDVDRKDGTGVTDAGQPREKEALAKSNDRLARATKLIGTDVEDPSAKNLGDVEDVVIDDATGRIVYTVLSFGGFLGMGDKLFAIPYDALRPNPKDDDKLVLDISKDKLKAAPGFDKNNWPNMADRRWGTEIHRYYDREPYWDRMDHDHDGQPEQHDKHDGNDRDE
jgi:sporulation protein YlmC with PRC-barrel domain